MRRYSADVVAVFEESKLPTEICILIAEYAIVINKCTIVMYADDEESCRHKPYEIAILSSLYRIPTYISVDTNLDNIHVMMSCSEMEPIYNIEDLSCVLYRYFGHFASVDHLDLYYVPYHLRATLIGFVEKKARVCICSSECICNEWNDELPDWLWPDED